MRFKYKALEPLFKDIAAWSGLVSSAVGGLSNATGIQFALPAFAWWGIGTLLLLFAAGRAYVLLYADKNKKPKPTMCLSDLVSRLTDRPDIESYIFDPVSERMDGIYTAIGEALKDIREQAYLQAVTVWGRKGDWQRNAPRGYISNDHWNEFRFDYLDFLRDKRGKSVDSLHGQGYSDFWFDQNEVDAAWPPKRKKIKWRAPWVTERAARTIFSALTALFVLSSCLATTQEVASGLENRFIGKNADALVSEFGPPYSTFKMNSGETAYAWQLSALTLIDTDRGSGTANTIVCRVNAVASPMGIVSKISTEDVSNRWGESFCAKRLGMQRKTS